MSVKRTTVYFEKPGKEHTGETLRIALEGAKERGIDTVLVSSTTGYSAFEALKVFERSGLKVISSPIRRGTEPRESSCYPRMSGRNSRKLE